VINVTAIERRSSLAFLDAVFDAHSRGEVAFPVSSLGKTTPAGLHITRQVSCASGGGWFDRHVEPQCGTQAAQVTLTSGTTGKPKAILLSHRNLADVSNRLISVMGLTDEVREYVGVPVTYSFGFGRVRAVSAVGGACFLPENGFRVSELVSMLQNGEVNALSAVPTLLRLLIDQPSALGNAGNFLRWLEIGSQPMSVAEKKAVCELFPNARIIQHYGLTEASRSTFLAVSEASDEKLDSVGAPIGQVDIRITDVGRIAIRGPHVAAGVITAEGVMTLTDDDGWLTTNDLGRIEHGLLHFEGRADHLLNVGGVKVSAEIFEAQLLESVPVLGHFAIAGGKDALRGEVIVVAHDDNLSDDAITILHQAATELTSKHNVAGAFALMPMTSIPVTDTGKIKRAEISHFFNEVYSIREINDDDGIDLTEIYARALNRRIIKPDESFASLGGDSLGYIEVSIAIEERLGYLPEHWETLSIAHIAKIAPTHQRGTTTSTGTLETEMLIRPIAMTAIVTSHVLSQYPSLDHLVQYWGGGAVALLMAAGYNICRFQKGTLLSEHRHRVVTNYLKRVILPFYIIILYKCLQWALGGPYVAWSTFALLDDYIRYPDAQSFVVYWFIDVLLQCLIALTAIFYISPIRNLARQSGFQFGLSLLLLAYCGKIAVHIALLPKGALQFPNNQFDYWAYAFALGWMVGEARTDVQRLTCIILGVACVSPDWGLVNSHTIALFVALVMILYVPRVKMPSFLQRSLGLWARATFFIYLTHGFGMATMRAAPVQAIFGDAHVALAIATVAVSTIAGLGAYLLWRRGERLVAGLALRLQQRRVKMLPVRELPANS